MKLPPHAVPILWAELIVAVAIIVMILYLLVATFRELRRNHTPWTPFDD